MPNDRRDRERFLGHETGAVFRDEGYVYDQVVDLAAQLRAIADGAPKPPRTGATPPPLGLDPKKGQMTAASSGRDRVLPWGWQLRAVDGAVEDAEGRQWSGVRQAFWEGHLGFPHAHFVPEQLELLLRVLGAIDQVWVAANERKHDLFGGDMLFWRFYQCWLWSVGLLESGSRVDPLGASLSDEGRSVLAMLQATREPGWVALPFASVLDAVRMAGCDIADDEREAALRAFEGGVSLLAYLFAREVIGGRHVVTLTGMDWVARMPMRKVVWSQAFPDARVRDDFFAWIAVRVGRWGDWGALAYSKGADALTSHLLGLFAAGLSPSSSVPS